MQAKDCVTIMQIRVKNKEGLGKRSKKTDSFFFCPHVSRGSQLCHSLFALAIIQKKNIRKKDETACSITLHKYKEDEKY